MSLQNSISQSSKLIPNTNHAPDHFLITLNEYLQYESETERFIHRHSSKLQKAFRERNYYCLEIILFHRSVMRCQRGNQVSRSLRIWRGDGFCVLQVLVKPDAGA